MTPPKTVDQMVAEIIALDPKSSSFVSPYYISAIIDGQPVPLSTVDGRYGVGYVRVSTIGQQDDGWSVEDQARRIVSYFVSRREAFCVYSDASLSGKLPNNDAALIDKMLRTSARRYETAYRAVFRQSDYPEDWSQMEAHLLRTVERIKSGLALDGGVVSGDIDVEVGAAKRKALYRPALTKMMQAVGRNLVHTLAVTDVTRLARSQSLSASLTDELKEKKVKVVGLIESLDWMYDELGGAITSAILSVIAEYKLREVCLGSMRGLATMLSQGKPHGTLPYYLRRSDDGAAIIVPEHVDTVRRVIAFWIENPQMKVDAVCHFLNEHLDDYPAPVLDGEKRSLKAKGKWHRDTLLPMLKNEVLLGYQAFFGRRWRTVPQIIDEQTYAKLQIVIAPQRANSAAHRVQNGKRHTDPNHLLTGALQCQCGHAMTFYPMSKEHTYYRCTEIRHRAKTDEHCTIQAKSAEEFFERLVLIYGDRLISQLADNEDTRLLREQISELHDERKRLNAKLLDAQLAAKEKAENLLREGDSEVTPAAVAAIAKTNRGVLALVAQVESVEEQIRQREIILGQIIPEGQVETVKASITNWHTLPIPERNATLRSVIKHATFQLTNNGGMDVEITPVSLQPVPMPKVILNTTLYNKSKHLRRFPSVEEWIATW